MAGGSRACGTRAGARRHASYIRARRGGSRGRRAGAGCYTLPSMRAIHQLQGMMIRQITLPPW